MGSGESIFKRLRHYKDVRILICGRKRATQHFPRVSLLRNNISCYTGLDAAGKTTILYKLKLGEVVTTIPTIGMVDDMPQVEHQHSVLKYSYSRASMWRLSITKTFTGQHGI